MLYKDERGFYVEEKPTVSVHSSLSSDAQRRINEILLDAKEADSRTKKPMEFTAEEAALWVRRREPGIRVNGRAMGHHLKRNLSQLGIIVIGKTCNRAVYRFEHLPELELSKPEAEPELPHMS